MTASARARVARSAGIPTAIAILAAIVGVGVLAPSLSVADPMESSGAPLRRPGWEFPLGTNALGQDLLSQLGHGARRSLLVGVLVATASTILAAAIGIAAGTQPRGRMLWSSVIDLALAMPALPLVVLMLTFTGSGLWPLVMALSMTGWAGFARIVRTRVETAASNDHVIAAQALGASGARVVRTCIIPDVAPLLWTKFLLTVRWAILMDSSLGVLGLIDPARASWGLTLHQAFTYPFLLLNGSWWWWAAPPAIAISGVTVALAMLGREIDLSFNPAVNLHEAPGVHPAGRRRPRANTVPEGQESIPNPMGAAWVPR